MLPAERSPAQVFTALFVGGDAAAMERQIEDLRTGRSILGNGNNHDNHNLPVLLVGGGFKHGQHLAFDKANNHPLPNLYVSMLQRLGIETSQFATSKGTPRGLEFA